MMRTFGWLLFVISLAITACTSGSTTEVAQEAATAVPLNTSLPDPTTTTMPDPTDTAVPPPTNMPTLEPTATSVPTETPTFTIPRFSVSNRFTIYGEEPAVPRGSKQYTDPDI